MKKKVFLIYEGDQWLSYSSTALVCIANSREEAIEAIINHLKNDGESEEGLSYKQRQLEILDQTQGFDTNYLIEECEIGKWI